MSRRDASAPRERGHRHANLRKDAITPLHVSRRNVSTAGAGVQIFVKTLLRLLPTSRRDVSTPRERGHGTRRCLSRHCCAHVPHAATQCFDAGQSQHANLCEDTAGAAAHIATAGEQIFVKTPCVASRLLGHSPACRRRKSSSTAYTSNGSRNTLETSEKTRQFQSTPHRRCSPGRVFWFALMPSSHSQTICGEY